jgi:hypothetical protein
LAPARMGWIGVLAMLQESAGARQIALSQRPHVM